MVTLRTSQGLLFIRSRTWWVRSNGGGFEVDNEVKHIKYVRARGFGGAEVVVLLLIVYRMLGDCTSDL